MIIRFVEIRDGFELSVPDLRWELLQIYGRTWHNLSMFVSKKAHSDLNPVQLLEKMNKIEGFFWLV
jgi:hypothetical protein